MLVIGLLLGAAVVTPCVALYVLVIKGVDRYEPEPWWLLGTMFAWGALGATVLGIVGGLAGIGVLRAVAAPAMDDATFAATAAVVVAPVVEETAKGIGLLVLWAVSVLWLRELDGPLDGAIYGGVVGLGFTCTEDILYVAGAMAEGGLGAFSALFFVRTVLSGLGHASFTAVLGLGIGVAAESRSPVVRWGAPMAGWLLAVALHTVHNLLATFLLGGGIGLVVKVLLFWIIDLLFFAIAVALVLRDRELIREALGAEVGRLIGPEELRTTTDLTMLVPFANLVRLSRSPSGYRAARGKQRAMVELAFLKQRQARGETGLEADEQRLRSELEAANRSGVLIAGW
jgi:RsiW-degrading membrane proteinase PrsW (M82 family)